MKRRINEAQLRDIVRESVKRVLKENACDKRVQDYLKSRGYEDYKTRMKIIGVIKSDIPNACIEKGKFLPGLCRMYCDGQLNSEEAIYKMDRVLRTIHIGGYADKFDENLNGGSPTRLYKMFRNF